MGSKQGEEVMGTNDNREPLYSSVPIVVVKTFQ